MPEESKEAKAKSLAAARKRLKAYQKKEKRGSDQSAESNGNTLEHLPSGATSATLSEKSDSELNINGLDSGSVTPPAQLTSDVANPESSVATGEMHSFAATSEIPAHLVDAVPLAASYFNAMPSPGETALMPENFPRTPEAPVAELFALTPQTPQNINAIQVLISEKAQLNAELNKYRASCREKDLENEELRTQFTATTRRLDELQQRYLEQQQAVDQLRNSNSELQHQLVQSRALGEDQAAHLSELKKQLSLAHSQLQDLEQQHKEKCNELELSKIRINQLSDESSISQDNRVETLTQTQFMYEQQIRDLQAMVQQLTQDKEQSNTQYQNYVQHLNNEVTNVNEKNSELTEECTKLQEREQQLVEHISGLEREIQKNIARQDQMKETANNQQQINASATTSKTSEEMQLEINKLQDQISDFDFERHEFQLKIKSQEDRLEAQLKELQQKQQLNEQLQEHLHNINSEQPDKSKLLATMESDKIAASRALTQNVELKKQLDELELRFVQLTNDKAELMNKLDAEEYANRETRNAYAQMEEKLHSIDERFKFKDEEMIRLSHENMDLTRKNLIMQQQMDQLKHYEVSEYNGRYAKETGDNNGVEDGVESEKLLLDKPDQHEHEHHDHQSHEHHHHNNHNHHDHQNHHDHEHHDHLEHEHHDHSNDHHHDHSHGPSKNDECMEAIEAQSMAQHDHPSTPHSSRCYDTSPPSMPTSEAVVKLQQRFTQLMAHVADLTDEKQRLEHLVLQLQGETETIGEYIALYQTQRRILKQREYEKAAQMQLLQAEREQMQEKISVLNNLVSSLGAELPHNKRIAEHLSSALAESVSIEPADENAPHNAEQQTVATPTDKQQQNLHDEQAINQKLNFTESQEILTKIQSIITEIKENTKEIPTVTQNADHLNCCLGKFEVV